MKHSHKISVIILSLIVLALVFEIARDTFTKGGDFIGYVLVGNQVLDGENIYTDPVINTWPPFFSIVSVPIALMDNFNKNLVRFLWLIISVLAIYNITGIFSRMSINRKLKALPLKADKKITKLNINISHWIILIPTLLIFRYILDNLANIQINIFILLFMSYSLWLFSKGKDLAAALILAFSISIKIYPIFLLLYFVAKREHKIVIYTSAFTILFSIIPFLVFGYEQTLDYYAFWYNQNVVPFASAGHKNQSYFSMMRSLLTKDMILLNNASQKEISIGIANLSIEQVKLVSYALLASAATVVIYLFRVKLIKKDSLKSFLEYAFIFTIIPVLSPLSWKAYFIFLFPAFFLNYLFIFQFENSLKASLNRLLRIIFFSSVLLTVFSSEMFVGAYFSDILEAFSCITIGSMLIAFNILLFYLHYEKFDKKLKSDGAKQNV